MAEKNMLVAIEALGETIDKLRLDVQILKFENGNLREENARLSEENARLSEENALLLKRLEDATSDVEPGEGVDFIRVPGEGGQS